MGSGAAPFTARPPHRLSPTHRGRRSPHLHQPQSPSLHRPPPTTHPPLPCTRSYLRENLLTSLGDDKLFIRSAVGSCITTLIYAGGLAAWPTLVPSLYQLLDSPDPNIVDGSFSALHKVCEDSAEQLAGDASTLGYLIPKLLSFFGHAHPPFRRHALACVNHFALAMPDPLRAHIDACLQGLFALATDANPEVPPPTPTAPGAAESRARGGPNVPGHEVQLTGVRPSARGRDTLVSGSFVLPFRIRDMTRRRIWIPNFTTTSLIFTNVLPETVLFPL